MPVAVPVPAPWTGRGTIEQQIDRPTIFFA